MESDWKRFEQRGVLAVAIAAQKIDGITGARRFVQDHRYPFPLLFDETREVTRAYGVYHFAGIDAFRIARPAVFVLDAAQVIRWIAVSPNQRTFPTNAELLRAVDA